MLDFIGNKFLASILLIGLIMNIIVLGIMWRRGTLAEFVCDRMPENEKLHCGLIDLRSHRNFMIIFIIVFAILLLFQFLVIQRLWFCK